MTTLIYNGPYDATHYQVLSRVSTSGDNISGYLLDGQRYRNTSLGEHGHCLYLGAVTDGTYSNIEAVDAHGDGICISSKDPGPGGPHLSPAERVTLQNVKVRNAHRNGIAIIGGHHITIDGFQITGVDGVSPSAGTDLEPDVDSAANSYITIRNGWIEGCRDFGIVCDNTSGPTENVTIEHTTVLAHREGWALWLRLSGGMNYVRHCTFFGPCTNLFNTTFEHCTFVSFGSGLHARSAYCIEMEHDSPVTFNNCQFIGPKQINGANKTYNNCVDREVTPYPY